MALGNQFTFGAMFPLAICAGSPSASSAGSTAIGSVGVLWRELVAILAMGLHRGRTAAHIFKVRDWLQVVRIDASAVAARVVQFVAGRYFASVQSIGNQVRPHLATVATDPIALLVFASKPKPAAIVQFLNFVVKALLDRSSIAKGEIAGVGAKLSVGVVSGEFCGTVRTGFNKGHLFSSTRNPLRSQWKYGSYCYV